MGGPGSGHHLEPVVRRLIWYYYHIHNKTPFEIHEILFDFPDHLITLDHVVRLCRWFDQANTDKLETYLSGFNEKNRYKGRPFSLSADDLEHLRDILRERGTRNLKSIAEELYLRIEDEVGHISSISAVRHHLNIMKITRKVT